MTKRKALVIGAYVVVGVFMFVAAVNRLGSEIIAANKKEAAEYFGRILKPTKFVDFEADRKWTIVQIEQVSPRLTRVVVARDDDEPDFHVLFSAWLPDNREVHIGDVVKLVDLQSGSILPMRTLK